MSSGVTKVPFFTDVYNKLSVLDQLHSAYETSGEELRVKAVLVKAGYARSMVPLLATDKFTAGLRAVLAAPHVNDPLMAQLSSPSVGQDGGRLETTLLALGRAYSVYARWHVSKRAAAPRSTTPREAAAALRQIDELRKYIMERAATKLSDVRGGDKDRDRDRDRDKRRDFSRLFGGGRFDRRAVYKAPVRRPAGTKYGLHVLGEFKKLRLAVARVFPASTAAADKDSASQQALEAFDEATSRLQQDVRDERDVTLGEFAEDIDALHAAVAARIAAVEAEPTEVEIDFSKAPNMRDFLRYCGEGHARESMPAAARFSPADLLESTLTLAHLYEQLAVPAMELSAKGVRWLDGELKRLPEADAKHRDVKRLRDALDGVARDLMTAVGSGRKPAFLTDAVAVLRTAPGIAAMGDLVVAEGRPQAGDIKAPGAGSDGGAGGTLLFRAIDRARVSEHLAQLKRFKVVATSALQAEAAQRLQRDLDALRKATVGDGRTAEESALVARLSAEKYLLAFRATVAWYVARHAEFAGGRHQGALRYVAYWSAHAGAVADADTAAKVEEYGKTRAETVDAARAFLSEDCRKSLLDGWQSDWGVQWLDAPDLAALNAQFTEALQRLDDQGDAVAALYAGGGSGLLHELASNPDAVAILGLKALRLLVLWGALRVAANVFQEWYDHQVYKQEVDPPSPLRFVGLVVALDAAVNVGILVVMTFVIWVSGRSPAESTLLRAWALDYVASTAIIASLAAIIGAVVAQKRFFGYKYQGQRAVQGMQRMTFFVCCVMLFVPYWRLA